MTQTDPFASKLKSFYGKRCVVKGAFTYDNGLYFYAFDATKEAKASDEILETVIGRWDQVLAHVREGVAKPEVKNIVMFGVTVADDDNEGQEDTLDVWREKGITGLLAEVGASTPGPLIYDRSNGNTYFFPEGSPYTLGAGGEEAMTLQELEIEIVED